MSMNRRSMLGASGRMRGAWIIAAGIFAASASAQTAQTFIYLPPSADIDTTLPRPIAPLPPGMNPIFDSKTLNGWRQDPIDSWMVKDGIIGSRGVGRGVLFTTKTYRNYRIVFDVRHVSGNPDHQACVLFFGLMPKDGEKPVDMLKGIQFQVPLGGTWDYRDGHHNDGKGEANGNEYDRFPKPPFDSHQWSRVEILINADKGTARLAVAQPVGGPAIEIGRFHVPEAGRQGPFALQMHNQGLFDEYANLAVEENPARDELITVAKVRGVPFAR